MPENFYANRACDHCPDIHRNAFELGKIDLKDRAKSPNVPITRILTTAGRSLIINFVFSYKRLHKSMRRSTLHAWQLDIIILNIPSGHKSISCSFDVPGVP